jgi:hypothetical protein
LFVRQYCDGAIAPPATIIKDAVKELLVGFRVSEQAGFQSICT